MNIKETLERLGDYAIHNSYILEHLNMELTDYELELIDMSLITSKSPSRTFKELSLYLSAICKILSRNGNINDLDAYIANDSLLNNNVLDYSIDIKPLFILLQGYYLEREFDDVIYVGTYMYNKCIFLLIK